jgi:hypothetical protein
MRLAVEARYVMFKLLNDNIVVVLKRPIRVSTGCWLRVRRIGYISPFLVRGGVKLFPADTLIGMDGKSYHVIAMRKLRYATIAVADRMVEPVEVSFVNSPLILRDGYLVFEVDSKEAKLVNAEPTHVMMVFEHTAYFKRAEIIFKGEGNIVFNDWVACRQKSIAMAVVFVPVGSQFTVCFNDVGNKYRCLDMLATIPPVTQRKFYTETPDLN